MTEASPTPTNDPSQKSSPTSDIHPSIDTPARDTVLDQGGWDSLPGESESEVDYKPEETGPVVPEPMHPSYQQQGANFYTDQRGLVGVVASDYLEVEITVTCPDGRRYTTRQEVEYKPEDHFEFEDAESLFDRAVEQARFIFG